MAPTADSDFDSLILEARHIRQQAWRVLREAETLRLKLEHSLQEMRRTIYGSRYATRSFSNTNGHTPDQQP